MFNGMLEEKFITQHEILDQIKKGSERQRGFPESIRIGARMKPLKEVTGGSRKKKGLGEVVKRKQ